MQYTKLDESPEYQAEREKLRLAELELMRQTEAVAEQRRNLPVGPAVEDYVFEEGPANLADGDTPVRKVKISELFSGPDRPLVVYHFMYGKAQTDPCPMCTQWIDGFNGVSEHLAQNVDFVVAAAADLPTLRSWARARGWDRLRLLSCGDNTFKHDLLSEDDDGKQDSTMSVFTRDADGAVRHRYTVRPRMSADVEQRGIDKMCATWNVLDLTPNGRGDWYSSLDYL